MSNVAVNVAVIYEGKILLTKREDFEVWCLPSGGVEKESRWHQRATGVAYGREKGFTPGAVCHT